MGETVITAFEQGRDAAKQGKKVLDNPYPWCHDAYVLWNEGFVFQLEQDAK